MKVTVEFDTKTKKMVVRKGGVEVANVESVTFYSYYDDPKKAHVDINTVIKDDEEKTVTVTRVMASGKVLIDPPEVNSEIVSKFLGL